MTEPRAVPVKPRFGGFVLETLTVGMYGESRNALREYVQNGFDSIQSAIAEQILGAGDGKITITYKADPDKLIIRDNGAGLAASIATETLTSVGASRKDYRTDAGFRGIGRLAGITFSNRLIFKTKAKGENERTVVTFDAVKMRHMMSPEHGNDYEAVDLMQQCVTAQIETCERGEAPYFEVILEGFTEAPRECTEPEEMRAFLSQVAPVDYADDFPFKARIHALAQEAGHPIPTVAIEIHRTDGKILPVRKAYGARYELQDAPELVALTDIRPYRFGNWWGWMSERDVSGTFVDDKVRGVRVRAKNIQIDGADVVAEIFRRFVSKSSERYQQWIIGEIFVDLKTVIPNARRDGFEETKIWTDMRKEIAGSMGKDAGTQAQNVSTQGQLSLPKLTEKSGKIRDELEVLRRNDFKNADRTINLSAQVTKLQAEVSRASKNADPSTQAALTSLNSELIDIKTEAVRKLVPQSDTISAEAEQGIQDAIIADLLAVFERKLELPCLSAVRAIIRDEYDWPRG